MNYPIYFYHHINPEVNYQNNKDFIARPAYKQNKITITGRMSEGKWTIMEERLYIKFLEEKF